MTTNRRRAVRASAALDAYAGDELADEPTNTVLIDLLADLRHFCRQNHISFARALRISRYHFAAERPGGSVYGT